ncbi:MAG: glycosyltransferase family 1 protein [Bacteroidales bacterium]|nr:glycosyltransferase family 1 protein [Bacteroidales bacterium]
MRIVIDNIIFSWQRSGGISVVWGELLKGLLAASDAEVQILEYEGASAFNIVRRHLHIAPKLLRRLSRHWFIFKRYMSRAWHFQGVASEPFIFHSSYYRYSTHAKAINVVTVHDFIYERFTHSLATMIHRWQKRAALRAADIVVCISQNTKDDLLHYYPEISPERIRIIHNGVSDTYQPLPHEYTPPLTLQHDSYLLFVGSRAAYKRFDIAVATAQATGQSLAIVGPPLSSAEQALLNQHRVCWHAYGYLEEQALRYLYAKATALIYASEYEGFGIPIVEAQRCGCPVIACGFSSIPEVIGDYPILLTRPDVTEAMSYVDRLLHEPLFREKVVSLGYANAKRFSWQRMQEQYIQLYRDLWQTHHKP